MSSYFFFLVHRVSAAWRTNSLPAGVVCGASSHIARLELGLLRRVRLLPRLVSSSLDRLPPAGTERHINLQADFPSHPPWLPGNSGVPGHCKAQQSFDSFCQTSAVATGFECSWPLWANTTKYKKTSIIRSRVLYMLIKWTGGTWSLLSASKPTLIETNYTSGMSKGATWQINFSSRIRFLGYLKSNSIVHLLSLRTPVSPWQCLFGT